MPKKPKATERLEQAVASIRRRNAHVEVEKAWERSWLRRLLVTAFTYATAFVFLTLANHNQEQALTLSAVPAAAYIISTLSLPWAKKIWMRRWIRKFNARKKQAVAAAALASAKKKSNTKKASKKKASKKK